MDDLSKVGLEVSVGQVLEIGQSCRRDVSLPLEVTLAPLNHFSQTSTLLNKVNEGSLNLELLGGNRAFARGRQSHSGLLVSLNRFSGLGGSIPHVGSEDNDVEVLVDVVHNLGLEESLGSVIHDLVAELGLGNVLSELLDAGASSLLGAVKVNNFVSIILRGNTILHLSNELLDNLKLSSEKGVLGLVHDVLVCLKDSGIEAGDSLNEALVAGGDLELLEETGHDTGRGGAGEADLVIDDDRGVDAGANQGVHHDVKVSLKGGSGVADRDSPVNKSRELLLEALNGLAQALELLNLNLRLLLVNVNHLELASINALPALALTKELGLLLLDNVSGDGPQLGVLPNLVGRPGADGLTIDIDIRLLPHVEPDDGAILGVGGAANLLQGLLKSLKGRLTTAVDLEAGHPPEVGTPGDGVGELLDLVEVIQHADRLLHVP